MSDLTARAIADLRDCITLLKAELAESRAAANKVTESMGSEILRLQGELEKRTAQLMATQTEMERQRALVAERDCTIIALVDERDQQRTHAEAAEQELRMVSEAFKRHMAEGRSKPEVRVAEANALSALFDDVTARNKLAAIRAHLAGVDVAKLMAMQEAASPPYWRAVSPRGTRRMTAYVVVSEAGALRRRAFRPEDAAAIAALRNAAPVLLAAAREALEP